MGSGPTSSTAPPALLRKVAWPVTPAKSRPSFSIAACSSPDRRVPAAREKRRQLGRAAVLVAVEVQLAAPEIE